MNYMDEQILSIKNKLNHNAASNNENTLLSQTTVNNHDKTITEKIHRYGWATISFHWK